MELEIGDVGRFSETLAKLVWESATPLARQAYADWVLRILMDGEGIPFVSGYVSEVISGAAGEWCKKNAERLESLQKECASHIEQNLEKIFDAARDKAEQSLEKEMSERAELAAKECAGNMHTRLFFRGGDLYEDVKKLVIDEVRTAVRFRLANSASGPSKALNNSIAEATELVVNNG